MLFPPGVRFLEQTHGLRGVDRDLGWHPSLTDALETPPLLTSASPCAQVPVAVVKPLERDDERTTGEGDRDSTKCMKVATNLLLKSSIDAGTSVPIDIESACFSSTMLAGLSDNCGPTNLSEPVSVPACTAAIRYTAEWMKLQHRHKAAPNRAESRPPSYQPSLDNLGSDLFASVVSLVDFLGVDAMRAYLLGSFGTGVGLSHLRACHTAIPHLQSLLCATVLETAEPDHVAALLSTIDASANDDACATGLAYELLDLCDGGARAAGSHLGLTEWAGRERERRSAAVAVFVKSQEPVRQAAVERGTAEAADRCVSTPAL